MHISRESWIHATSTEYISYSRVIIEFHIEMFAQVFSQAISIAFKEIEISDHHIRFSLHLEESDEIALL